MAFTVVAAGTARRVRADNRAGPSVVMACVDTSTGLRNGRRI